MLSVVVFVFASQLKCTPKSLYSDLQSRSRMRRRVAPMAQELLFGDVANGNNRGDDEMSRSYTIQDGAKGSMIPLMRVPSAPGSLRDHK